MPELIKLANNIKEHWTIHRGQCQRSDWIMGMERGWGRGGEGWGRGVGVVSWSNC